MAKNNKELLLLAAKAVECYIDSQRYDEHWGFAIAGTATFWNPLENDGDAFCLAIKLNMKIFPGEAYPYREEFADYRVGECCDEDEEPNKYKATRIAIVRVAAKLGEAKL